jgi:hypothetical protein
MVTDPEKQPHGFQSLRRSAQNDAPRIPNKFVEMSDAEFEAYLLEHQNFDQKIPVKLLSKEGCAAVLLLGVLPALIALAYALHGLR